MVRLSSNWLAFQCFTSFSKTNEIQNWYCLTYHLTKGPYPSFVLEKVDSISALDFELHSMATQLLFCEIGITRACMIQKTKFLQAMAKFPVFKCQRRLQYHLHCAVWNFFTTCFAFKPFLIINICSIFKVYEASICRNVQLKQSLPDHIHTTLYYFSWSTELGQFEIEMGLASLMYTIEEAAMLIKAWEIYPIVFFKAVLDS